MSRREIVEKLGDFGLFAILSNDNRAELAKTAVLRSFGKGERLFIQEHSAEGFYGILKGKVKIVRVGGEGREQILHIYGKGDVCGEVPVFQGGRYPATAEAMSEVEAVFLSGEAFLDTAQKHPEILLEMLAMLSLRLRKFVNLVDDLSLKEVSARAAKYLLDRAVSRGSDTIELDVSKSVLASRLGTISETLSRILKKMSESGVIDVQGKTVLIRDREQLMELAAGKKL